MAGRAEISGSRTVRIATRAGRLALWQANYVAGLLRAADPVRRVELVTVSTIGDRDRSEPLHRLASGQGVFTREVQAAVLDGRADVAVHSLKDLPTVPHQALALAGVPVRAVRFDLLIRPRGFSPMTVESLPNGARVGTGSLRRRAQLLHVRPDLQMEDIRGNVETRLRKLDEGEFDAIVLAAAGLDRLDLAEWPRSVLRPPLMYPAVGQAAIGIECRNDDEEVVAALSAITDPAALAEVTAERSCLFTLKAGCHAPVGVLAEITGEQLTLTGVVLSADGRVRIEAGTSGEVASATEIGRTTAERLTQAGADPLIRAAD